MTKKIFSFIVMIAISIASYSTPVQAVDPPTVEVTISNVVVSDITQTSAVITWDSNKQGTTEYRYAEDSSSLAQTEWIALDSEDSTTSHSVTLRELNDDTWYAAEVRTTGSSTASDSKQINFTTRDPSKWNGSIEVSNVEIEELNPTTATISWTSNVAGDSQAAYATSIIASYEWKVYELYTAGRTQHKVTLTGLESNSNYVFYVRTTNVSAGEAEIYQGEFTTPNTMAITGVEVGSITSNQAVVSWNTTKTATSRIWYGTQDTINGRNFTVKDDEYKTAHSLTLSNLQSGTKYYYRVSSTDETGKLVESISYNFTTKADVILEDESGNVELFIKEITVKDGGIYVYYGNLGPDDINGGFAVTLNNGQKTLRNEVPVGEKISSGKTTSTFFNLSPGTYTVEAMLDADNDITEGDEGNNTMTKTITIGGTDSFSDDTGVTYYSDKNSVGPLPAGYNEWVIVNATTNGPQIPAVSEYRYKGVIEVMMDGVIKASGTSLSDAYYILTDYDGNTVNPIPAREFGLHVNGRRLADFWPQKYIQGSQYIFKANLGPNYQNIKFSIGDNYRSDNSGSFKLAIKGDAREVNEIKNITDYSDDYTPVNTNTNLGSDKVDRLILKLERTISKLEQKVVDLEKKLVKKIDKSLTRKVKGRILLQVENNGEAWYVDPESENKFYMKDGQASYDIMRSLGLGITNKDLETIPIGIQENIYTLQDSDGDNIPDNLEVAIGTDPNKADSDGDSYDDKTEILNGYRPDGSSRFSFNQGLINRLQGRIVLQVESHGEAWYINPTDGRRYYLGDGNTAYNIMRFLSLGINNENLRKIQVGEYEE